MHVSGLHRVTDFVNSVTLFFEREQLLYDIKNYAFIEGDIMPTEDEHSRHQVMDIGEDGNINRVTRVLDLAYSECVDMLYPYSKRYCDREETRDDTLDEQDTYFIWLRVPRDFSQTTVELLAKLIHEYMVCRVLADWMSITNPARKKNWDEKVIDIARCIRESINARCRRVRRSQSPF